MIFMKKRIIKLLAEWGKKIIMNKKVEKSGAKKLLEMQKYRVQKILENTKKSHKSKNQRKNRLT